MFILSDVRLSRQMNISIYIHTYLHNNEQTADNDNIIIKPAYFIVYCFYEFSYLLFFRLGFKNINRNNSNNRRDAG